MLQQPMKVDAEMIHNWSQRYIGLTYGQYAEIPHDIRADLMRAEMRHHRGSDAQAEANALAAKYPGQLYA